MRIIYHICHITQLGQLGTFTHNTEDHYNTPMWSPTPPMHRSIWKRDKVSIFCRFWCFSSLIWKLLIHFLNFYATHKWVNFHILMRYATKYLYLQVLMHLRSNRIINFWTILLHFLWSRSRPVEFSQKIISRLPPKK